MAQKAPRQAGGAGPHSPRRRAAGVVQGDLVDLYPESAPAAATDRGRNQLHFRVLACVNLVKCGGLNGEGEGSVVGP